MDQLNTTRRNQVMSILSIKNSDDCSLLLNQLNSNFSNISNINLTVI